MEQRKFETRELFYLDKYLEKRRVKNKVNDNKKEGVKSNLSQIEKFMKLCKEVDEAFKKEWQSDKENNDSSDKLLETQKKAIIGHDNEVNFFKGRIQEYLKDNNLSSEWFPRWYDDLVSAIFHEVWGLVGLSEWWKYKDSSSAKIIGNRIYFLLDGEIKLQEQTISTERLEQLKRSLLMGTPEVRISEEHHAEVYMLDNTRIAIFDRPLTKEVSIVFRKDTVDLFTFEEQAKKKTIDFESIRMQRAMVDIGYNVLFSGPVRSAKTTYLKTWQSYENPLLEGIQIETDSEIQLHKLMPNAPIIQVVADGEDLDKVIKKLLRSDADYIIVAEARDPYALKVALEATAKGTRRVKSTYHITYAEDFPYMAANSIVGLFGGDLYTTIALVSKAFNYIYEFVQLKDKSQKRLKSIKEIRYNNETGDITFHCICKYNFTDEDWTYKYDIGEDKREIGEMEDSEAFRIFDSELKRLSELKPMKENNITIPTTGRRG